jgi:sulfur-oxidizing protein SoxY
MADRRAVLGLGLMAGAAVIVPQAGARAEDPPSAWPEIRDALYAGREIRDGAGVIALDTPARAYDAAVVPVTIRALIPQTLERYIQTMRLIVDVNPAPVAGTFHFYPLSGDATLSTRIRVNAYTDVRAVAETSDGAVYMVSNYVKAAGGCSAPSMKDAEEAMARIGRMKLNQRAALALGQPNRVQLLISHPQYTGLQMDQVSRNWIPPDYIQTIAVTFAGQPVLTVEGDISLSEDPSLTFSFVPAAPGELKVTADDTSQRHFEKRFGIGGDKSS